LEEGVHVGHKDDDNRALFFGDPQWILVQLLKPHPSNLLNITNLLITFL
jgi:hypothetical protein